MKINKNYLKFRRWSRKNYWYIVLTGLTMLPILFFILMYTLYLNEQQYVK